MRPVSGRMLFLKHSAGQGVPRGFIVESALRLRRIGVSLGPIRSVRCADEPADDFRIDSLHRKLYQVLLCNSVEQSHSHTAASSDDDHRSYMACETTPFRETAGVIVVPMTCGSPTW